MQAYYYSDLLCKESKWSKVKCPALLSVFCLLHGHSGLSFKIEFSRMCMDTFLNLETGGGGSGQ